MMFEINIPKNAGKFLKKLSGKPLKQIEAKLLMLLENPFPQDRK
jgi:mRNA-degrading endonuclease RelE of RelBE toxin-antitoxin system